MFRWSWFVLGTLVLAACERSKSSILADSAAPQGAVRADSNVAAVAAATWDPNAGPVLLVAGENPTRAIVIAPENAASLATLPRPASVTLFSRSGTVQTAELPGISDAGTCIVATLNATPPPRPWNVGFVGGVVAPLPMDSTESLSQADSVSLVADVTRLASALPNDSAGRFSGLPFVVRAIWRMTLPDGPQVVVAKLVRQINQEATPLQEDTFIIAEHATATAELTTAYTERSYGAEETIESRDVLAAALLGASRNPAIILSRDFGNATAYGLVERGDDGHWRSRWSSAPRSC